MEARDRVRLVASNEVLKSQDVNSGASASLPLPDRDESR